MSGNITLIGRRLPTLVGPKLADKDGSTGRATVPD